jgi:glycosyltransferase involved in cell wall biosynthesis
MTRVALVVTVRNEAETIGELLSSIDAQSLAPDEIVFVDGGSTDGTYGLLERWTAAHPHARAVSAPGSNIAAGRNLAIGETSSPIVAVTDAGCILEPRWLEHLATALHDADVAMGYYQPRTKGAFEGISTCLTVPDPDEIDAQRFMPSSRSIAFRRGIWESAGGYPEWLDIGEDMYFNFRVLDSGARRRFVAAAIARWRPRATFGSFLRQYFRYARGDAIAGMYPRRHALRFGAYAAAIGIGIASTRWPWLIAIPVAAMGFRLRTAYRRAFTRLNRDRMVAVVAIPVIAVLQDVAKMAGYLSGLPHRRCRT